MSSSVAEEGSPGLLVSSDVMPDGTYRVSVAVGEDRVWQLDRDAAIRYGVTVLAVVQTAEHDAAVFTMLTQRLGLELNLAGQFLGNHLRPDRPPADETATAPLAFRPGVTKAGKPFIMLMLDGQPFGQLDLPEARDHGRFVIESSVAVDLDAALHRVLIGVLGLDDRTARAVVGDLATHRWGIAELP
jgi:hypothetical protein